jgi:WD40 repeat protein
MPQLVQRLGFVLAGLGLVVMPLCADPPSPALPAAYQDVARTGRARLTAVWGSPNPQGPATAVAFSPDGKLALSAKAPGPWDPFPAPAADYAFTLRDARTLHALKTFAGHTGPVLALAFAPDGRSFFAGTADCVVLRFELTNSPP